VGDHDKKGVLFEKREGVHGKHDNNVLEKRHSGSARLVQDSALSEVPSDDREASVECDPLSKVVTDSGIFGCGMNNRCVESEESGMGGFCVADNMAPSINRALQQNVTCVGTPRDGLTCDCSDFDNTNSVGNFTCREDFCYETVCGNSTYSQSNAADGWFSRKVCRNYNATVLGLESYCFSFSFSSDPYSAECEIEADDVVCNSCKWDYASCPAGSLLPTFFDCTNTVMNFQGDTCDGTVLAMLYYASMPTTAPPETGSPSASSDEMPSPATAPTRSGPPSASPNEMPSPVTSSGSSHAAKVTVVVSVAAAACVASFGT
jgi:hypothetical protein